MEGGAPYFLNRTDMLSDLARKYEHLMNAMAKIHGDQPDIVEQIFHAKVTGEEWDDGHGGGHLRFEISATIKPIDVYTIDAWSSDADGVPIDIIFHTVSGLINWGEWYKVTGSPISTWPPNEIWRYPMEYRGPMNGT